MTYREFDVNLRRFKSPWVPPCQPGRGGRGIDDIHLPTVLRRVSECVGVHGDCSTLVWQRSLALLVLLVINRAAVFSRRSERVGLGSKQDL